MTLRYRSIKRSRKRARRRVVKHDRGRSAGSFVTLNRQFIVTFTMKYTIIISTRSAAQPLFELLHGLVLGVSSSPPMQ